MNKFFYMAVAAIAALSSCSNDDSILSEFDKSETGITAFTATIEEENATRATLNNKTPNWEAGDVISIDGHDYTASEAGTAVTFTGTGASEPTHHAYFPANLYNEGVPTLPAEQTYTAGKFNMPMYAESTTNELQFKNLCAVLAVKVASGTVKKIKVVANKRLNGAFTATAAGALTFTATNNPSEAERTVTLNCGAGVTANNTIFYIAIPAQDYKFLNIYLSADGTNYKEAMGTKAVLGIGTIARNKIFNINYATNAFQMWAGGAYFATQDAGRMGYNAAMTGSGDNWNPPTSGEWDALQNNTNRSLVTINNTKCIKYTAKNNYTNNSITLSGTSNNLSGTIEYWTSNAANYWGQGTSIELSYSWSGVDSYRSNKTTGTSNTLGVRLVLRN